MPKERHPFWISLPQEKRELLIGECGEPVVKQVDVVADAISLENTTVLVDVTCQKYPDGETLHEPLVVFSELDREERVPLVLKVARVSLGEICVDCPHRLSSK